MQPKLDPENENIGYLFGRLLATLDRIQYFASRGTGKPESGGLNKTIIDRYYGKASVTPLVIFPELMRLGETHLGTIRSRKRGLAVNLEKDLDQLVGMIRARDLPRSLESEDQMQFALGFHHQRAYRRFAQQEAGAQEYEAEIPDEEDE